MLVPAKGRGEKVKEQNTQKSAVLPCTGDAQLRIENKNTIHFHWHQKVKYLGLNLTKCTQALNEKN